MHLSWRLSRRTLTSLMFLALLVVAASDAAAERPRYHYDNFDVNGSSPYINLTRCEFDENDVGGCTSVFAYYELDDADPELDYWEFFITLDFPNPGAVEYFAKWRLWCRVDPASLDIKRDATSAVMDVQIDITTATCLENAIWVLIEDIAGYQYAGPAFSGVVTFSANVDDPNGQRTERYMRSETSNGDRSRLQCQIFSGWGFQQISAELNGVSLATDNWQSFVSSVTCPRPPEVAQ